MRQHSMRQHSIATRCHAVVRAGVDILMSAFCLTGLNLLVSQASCCSASSLTKALPPSTVSPTEQ